MGINKDKRNEMVDYLVEKLRASDESVDAIKFHGNPIGETDIIKVGSDGVVIPVNRVFVGDSFKQLYGVAKQNKSRVGVVFYKDGETFFRSAAEKGYFKKLRDNRSLKKYTVEDMQKMILTRPEEFYMSGIEEYVQYYQPKSERLEQGIVSFKFAPVRFDYSHIDSGLQFKPENRNSDKLKLWADRKENTGPLGLNRSYVTRYDPVAS